MQTLPVGSMLFGCKALGDSAGVKFCVEMSTCEAAPRATPATRAVTNHISNNLISVLFVCFFIKEKFQCKLVIGKAALKS